MEESGQTSWGGLFRVTEDVFFFFQQLEEKSRLFVNRNFLDANIR